LVRRVQAVRVVVAQAQLTAPAQQERQIQAAAAVAVDLCHKQAVRVDQA
jgi:hypothetical protein